MTIAVFGPTGRTGRLFVQKALAAGHKVRVLARDPDKLAPVWGLEMIRGDALDGGKVMLTLTGCEAVAVFTGPVKGSPADFSEHSTTLILQAMKKLAIKPLVAVSGHGVADSRSELPWFFRLIVELFLKKVFVDKANQETAIKASTADWTILRPTSLTDQPETGTWFEGFGAMAENLPAGTKIRGAISRGDVANLALKALGQPEYNHQTVWQTT